MYFVHSPNSCTNVHTITLSCSTLMTNSSVNVLRNTMNVVCIDMTIMVIEMFL